MLERISGDDGTPDEGGKEWGHVPWLRVPVSDARSTAADVSSHEVSMARTSIRDRPFPVILPKNEAQEHAEEDGPSASRPASVSPDLNEIGEWVLCPRIIIKARRATVEADEA